MTHEFQGIITGGKLKLADRPLFEQYLHTLNGIVVLTVEKYRRKRSSNQNRWYFGVVLKLISDHTGEDVQSLHEAFKMQFSEMRDVHGLKVPQRTSGMDTTDFSQHCERVRQWAAEFLGLNIPDPTPDFENQPLDSSNQPLPTNEHTMSEEEVQTAPAEETTAQVEAPADVPVAEPVAEEATEPQAEAAPEQI
jgi:hypothetical protein